MSKDIVKSSAQFVYVNDPNRVIRAQIQVGTPLVGLPQWNPQLEVFVPDANGSSIDSLGFDPSRLVFERFVHTTPGDEWVIKPMLGDGNQDVLPDGFNGVILRSIEPGDDGKFHVTRVDETSLCTVWLARRGNPDDSIPSVYFTEFYISDNDQVSDIFIKYTYECDAVSKHTHSVWGMLRLTPDPITMHQVMWFINS